MGAADHKQVLYLTDLQNCQPASALSADPKRHAWRVQAYETANLSGHMLIAGEETAAPEITYPLSSQGWYRICVGVYPEHRGGTAVLVKLTDDTAFCVLQVGRSWDRFAAHTQPGIHEVFWKEADLTGQAFHIGQVCDQVGSADEPASSRCVRARVAYIKLEPLSDEAVADLQADRQRSETRRLFAHNDAHGYLFLHGAATPEAVYREIEPYRHTDFSRLYWECGAGDLLFHLGQAGRLPTCDDNEDFERVGDRLHAEAWRAFRAKGLDPFKLALEYTHELGMEFHASYRPAGFYYPSPLEQWNAGSLYARRPDLRMIGKDGSPGPRISYAFADTRRFIIDLLLEVAQHPADGICILYNRRPPLIDFEPPLVAGFRQEYGQDPRQLPDDDPRWLAYRSIALTEFHRALRRDLDALAERQRRSKRIAVSVCVLNQAENISNGLDLETWIKEDLIDTLIPYTSEPELDSMAEAWPDLEQVHYFVALTRGTSCQLALNLMPRFMSPEDFRRKAAALYQAGVEHLFFWDSAGPNGRANYSPSWTALRRLGHQTEIETWLRAGEPSLVPEPIPFRRIGGYNMAYQTPG